jgi:cytoskeletal protein RodZ
MANSQETPSRQRTPLPGGETETVSFGTWLRRQRELREISLREVADVSKISIRYLEALEEDRFDVLPAPVFAKGFLREYARFVGLDPDEVVNSYLNAQRTRGAEEEAEPTAPPRAGGLDRTSGIFLALAIVGLLGVVGGLTYYVERTREDTDEAPPPIAAPAVVTEVAAPEPEQLSQAPLIVTLDFSQDCWVEAMIDDQRQISELHVPGESLRLEADQQVRLTLGNPEAVRVEVNGRSFPISAPAGAVARDIVIDLAAIAAADP